jgi:hypothetical protein
MDTAMRAVGQTRFCADVERFGVEWLISTFRSLVAESPRIRSECAAAVQANAAALSRQFDGLFAPRSAASSSRSARRGDTDAQVLQLHRRPYVIE